MNKTVAFYIMTYKGYRVLKEFLKTFTANAVEVVIIGQDKNIENDYSDDIKQVCTNNGILFFYRNDNYIIQSEYIFVISWRWIIHSDKNLIVLHDSILPKYRGFAPLMNMLINGEKEIGVTALFANGEYDCGDIIAQKSLTITYPITISDAINKITPLYTDLVNCIANKYFNNIKIIGTKQNDDEATYSLWRNEEDYFINWNDTAINIKRFIDAVGYPYKGATTFANNQKVRILNANVVNDLKIENRDVGKIIFFKNNCPVVVCREGLLQLENIVDDHNKVVQLTKFRIQFK